MSNRFKLQEPSGKLIPAMILLMVMSLSAVGQNMPRPEHPHHGKKRFINLNGAWDLQCHRILKPQESWRKKTSFDKKIIVPFAPESPLSGIGL